jgi:phospholipid/cholesterol/gamma-HCH transport system substrate-binding protein
MEAAMRWLNRLMIAAAFAAGAVIVIIAPPIWRLIYGRVHPVDHFHIVFTGPVSGLAVGDAVQRNGVVVGKVRNIILSEKAPQQVVVRVEIAAGVPVMRDSVASFGGSLITGMRWIEVTGGTLKAGRLHEGQEIIANENGPYNSFEIGSLEPGGEIGEALSIQNSKVSNRRSRGRVAQGVDDFSAAGRTLKVVGRELASSERWRSIDSTLANLNHASERLSHTLERVSVIVDNLSANREQYSRQFDATMVRLNHTLDEANRLFATSNRLMTSTDALVSSTSNAIDQDASKIEQTLAQIDRTARRLDESLQTFEPNPSSAIWGGWAGPKEPQ